MDGKSYMVQQRGDSFLDEPWDITHEGVVGDDWMERLLKIRRKELISVSGGLSALFPTPSEYDSYLGYCTRSHNNGESRKGFESNPHAVWASDTADLIEFTHLLNRKKIPGDADEIQALWHVFNKRN